MSQPPKNDLWIHRTRYQTVRDSPVTSFTWVINYVMVLAVVRIRSSLWFRVISSNNYMLLSLGDLQSPPSKEDQSGSNGRRRSGFEYFSYSKWISLAPFPMKLASAISGIPSNESRPVPSVFMNIFCVYWYLTDRNYSFTKTYALGPTRTNTVKDHQRMPIGGYFDK